MTIRKFVIQQGRVATRASISPDGLDEGLIRTARGALARLREGEPPVAISWPDGTQGMVGLGLPSLELPVERLSDAGEALREALESGRETRERKQRSTSFYVKTASDTEVYCLAREAANFEVATPWNLVSANKEAIERTNMASLYGAVAGTFAQVEKRKPPSERELWPSPDRVQQFWEVATEVVAAAPAFICQGRLQGSAATFADGFAVAMLSATEASPANTTAA